MERDGPSASAKRQRVAEPGVDQAKPFAEPFVETRVDFEPFVDAQVDDSIDDKAETSEAQTSGQNVEESEDTDGESWDSNGTTLTWGFIPPEGLDDDTHGPDIEEPFLKTKEIQRPVVETQVDEMFEDSSWQSIFANILPDDQGVEIDADKPIVETQVDMPFRTMDDPLEYSQTDEFFARTFQDYQFAGTQVDEEFVKTRQVK